MYQNHTLDPNLQRADERVDEGNYFIVDWICSDPMKAGRGVPIIIAGNATEEDLKNIAVGKLRVENPRHSTKQRVLLKVIKVTDLEA